ncbi:MAG: ABC transporter substrate-binding protein, partial [Dehalococcoidia bacterium]
NTRPTGQYYPCVSSMGMMWFKHDQAPFDDVRVRRAISMGIDREGIVEAVFRGEGVIPGYHFPSETEWATPYDELDPEIKQWYEHNPERARELLAEAGIPEGFEVTLWAPNHLGVPMNPLIEAVPSMLNDIGLDVTLNSVAIAQYNDTIQSGEFNDLAISKNPLGWGRLEGMLYKHWSQNPLSINRSNYDDPEFDMLLENALSASDPEEQRDWALQAERYFMEDVGMLELPGPYYYVAYQPWVKGELLAGGRAYRNQHGLLISGVWFEGKE